MKTIIISLLLVISLTTVALANGGNSAHDNTFHPHGDFYVGAYGSRDFARFKTDSDQNIAVLPPEPGPILLPQLNNYNYDWNADGFGGGLFLGYKYLVNPVFSVSAELFGHLSSLSGNFNGTSIVNELPNLLSVVNFTSKMRVPYSFGVSVLPGAKVNHFSTLFGRIGWVYSRFKFTNSGSLSGLLGPGNPVDFAGPSLNRSKNKSGVQVGVGLQSSVNDSHFAVRMEYDWSYYGRMRNGVGPVQIGTDPFEGGPITYSANVALDPLIEQFKVGVLYHFPIGGSDHNPHQFVVTHHPFGFYVGGYVSRDTANFETNANHVYTTTLELGPEIDSQPIKFDWSATGVDGGLLVGYQHRLVGRFTLGAEAFGDLSSLLGRFNSEFGLGKNIEFEKVHATVRLLHSLGLSLLPGIMINSDTSLFGRIGWVYSKFRYSDDSDLIGGSISTINGVPLEFSDSKSGIQLGLGMTTMLARHFGLRMEYDWSYYGRIRKSVGPVTVAPGDEPIAYDAHVSLKPTVNQFKVALVYYFAS